jgi:putative transposase
MPHLLITGPRHLKKVLQEFIEHYNTTVHTDYLISTHPPAALPTLGRAHPALRRERLGGLVHEYVQAA